MEVTAYQKYLRTSTKKMLGLGKLVTGMKAVLALERLSMTSEKGAIILTKVLKSAIANAKNNHKLNPESLVIKTVEIMKGPFLKRVQPVSRGMAHSIKKRTVHIKVILESNIKEKVIETEETIQKDNKEINLPEKVENRKIKKEEVK
jgi:large subunit ribosomal protein L22